MEKNILGHLIRRPADSSAGHGGDDTGSDATEETLHTLPFLDQPGGIKESITYILVSALLLSKDLISTHTIADLRIDGRSSCLEQSLDDVQWCRQGSSGSSS